MVMRRSASRSPCSSMAHSSRTSRSASRELINSQLCLLSAARLLGHGAFDMAALRGLVTTVRASFSAPDRLARHCCLSRSLRVSRKRTVDRARLRVTLRD